MTPKVDYGKRLQVELQRLNVSPITRVVRSAAGSTIELTDRQLGLLLRRVGNAGPDGCWIWNGSRRRKGGYGRFAAGYTRAGMTAGVTVQAHRAMYQLLKGPIPAGLTLDHLCRNPPCVNADHLEPCTIAENSARSPLVPSSINRTKTACPQGHSYDEVYRRHDGGDRRDCKECRRRRNRNSYHRRRSESTSRRNGRADILDHPKPVQPFQVTSHSPWKWEEVPLWPAE